jgi:hypothetical protein
MTTNGIPTTVDGLAQKWANLNDVQRAEALVKLRGTTSFRALAKRLGCSESLLRNLVQASQAPLPDRILASKKEISTRELVKRSKAAAKDRTATKTEAQDRARTKEAQKWCDVICDWLKTEGFTSTYGEQIVNEARRELFEAEQVGKIPQVKPPKEMTVEEIIHRCRPPKPKFDEISDVAWHSIWLARWALVAISDTIVRDRALGLALNMQITGESVRASKRKRDASKSS